MKWKIILAVVVIAVLAASGITLGLLLTRTENEKPSVSTQTKNGCNGQRVIMVSMDGFRADYLQRGFSPNINDLASNGVKAEYLTAQFPTKTFPNHYTIATGLYPESHGIVSNDFLSEDRKDRFSIGGATSMESKWWKGEPIWNTVRKQGLKSASFFWVGSEAKVNGMQPNYWKSYNGSIPYEERVDQVLKWLDMDPSARPSLMLLYFEEPDKQGHRHGPVSSEVNEAIKRVDDMIARLVQGIKTRNLSSCVNIVMTSDHGMANVSCSRVIYLDQHINQTLSQNKAQVVGQGAGTLIYTDNAGTASDIVKKLKGVKNMQAFLRDGGNIPKRLHYSNNKRIGDVILIPDQGWITLIRTGTCWSSTKGNHGYDYIHPDMRGIFVANGPAFKTGLVAKPLANHEVYNLIAEILNVKPAPNNGTIGSLSYMLKINNSPKMTYVKSVRDSENSPACKLTCQPDTSANNCSHLLCPGCLNLKENTSKFIKRLNLSAEQSALSIKQNLPWGVPKNEAERHDCILAQTNFVIGYNKYLRIPLWAGYKLTAKDARVECDLGVEDMEIDSNTQNLQGIPAAKTCLLQDPRLHSSETSSCSSSNYTKGQLAPIDDFVGDKLAQQDSLVLSNSVPQSRMFVGSQSLWKKTEDVIRKWTFLHKTLFVISGVIFDSNYDGLKDKDIDIKRWTDSSANSEAIPTHFYKIVVACNESVTSSQVIQGCNGKLESLAFVFPHNEEPISKTRNWQKDLLQYTASISDIEKLTGATFFPLLPYPFEARFKTALPGSLWPFL